MTPAMVAVLRESLREVCSLDDVKERMGKYMSTEACEEVLIMMCQICKNIDERRLKMKAHCPIVTDLRLKENATRIFLCYNPEWLRVGLHIVLGGDCLLQSGSWKRDKEVHFLKLLLEKQLFGQNGTGYTETLGNIILKRMFLLVAALDRAKMERTLPLKFGIDSLDGGSPPLFCHRANIKSSQQIIQKSLAEAMHGEGDLLVHLSIMGYKLNYQQLALSEYDFTIGNLFEDLHDGIILCRVVQLLLSDASIILKVIAPSDTHKKKLQNCTTAIQYIKQAGVPISDADGVTISAEDIANGDKELILSLLWNMFIHMQLPLVVNKTSLARELSRLKALAVEQPISVTKSHMGLLYDWIQVVCAKCGLSVESSQIDRRALNYFINHYLNISIHTCPLKKTFSDCRKELFSCHEQTATAISSCPSSKIEDLGDFLQDFPASGILANDVLFDEKGAIILIAFLCSHLTNDKRLEQLRNSISGRLDCQRLENRVSARLRSPGKNDVKYQSPQTEKAATIIQAQIRRIIAKNRYHKLKRSISILQGAIRAWSFVNMTRKSSCLTAASPTHARAYGSYSRYLIFILERHRFVRMRRSTIVIQQAVRIWIGERKRSENIEPFESHEFLETTASPKTDCIEMCDGSSLQTYTSLVSLDQSQHKRSHQSTELKIVLYSTLRLQRWWRKVLLHQSIKLSAISIQSSVRGWLARKQVKRITCCVHVIQRWWRNVMFLESRKRAATTIQSHVRGWIARQSAIRKKKSITIIQSFVKAYHVRKASKEEVVYIRSRIQKASAQVDDGMRLINRLIAALSQITGCRSISSIRQTCTTLSIATELSEKCCETLVDAGAVDILLKQIPRLNRGIPDQEVLKQVLYTLRNIARFPNVRPVLANNPQLVNTIFQELLRNKTDMFFIACGILMKLCESEEGRGFAGALRHHIRGLGSMVRGLEKKVELDKRNGRTGARKEDNLRRLGEAAALYHLLTDK
ncbi:abnormal spindle-like microcephaly-associated protein homolog isoform X4 [Hordeum vulgare subsp. vulgare]|uniref:abnormal spindle-like microcephaly-associated protein homolog isoform X4 n=1 Tax=Hordeum vulgare subsp. vulgare TaxID=112509 RepID=UPI001D1A3C44|nr:abnormal spindle-like microcephaly-associated protein homolog isoform X4 [Hordeum vulgare subsp. vulgare]